jgi:flagellar hook-length control protein FliK
MFQSQMDEVGSQISYWSAQGAQRASFTVGSAQDMPVEVTLSFADGALDVSFETEEEGVRELLENQAHEALQQLMDAQGIVLGGVSVGGGRSQAQRDSGNESTTVDMVERGRNRKPAAGSDATPPAARRTPEIMTATKLDLYA